MGDGDLDEDEKLIEHDAGGYANVGLDVHDEEWAWPAAGPSHTGRDLEEGSIRAEEEGGGHALFSTRSPSSRYTRRQLQQDDDDRIDVIEEDEESAIGQAGDGTASSSTSMGARQSRCEVEKLLFLFFYLVVAGLSNWAVLAYTHDIIGRIPLPDLVFNWIDEQVWAATTGDMMVSMTLICIFTMLAFHQHRVTIFRRVVFIAATLYAMRTVTLLATQLPPGYSNNTARCRPRENFTWSTFLDRWWYQIRHVGFQASPDMLCGDMLFSGHTLVMMTCCLTCCHYLPKKWRHASLLPTFFAYFGMICMIISRTHYTIDVVIAFWLTNLVFAAYHAYVEADLVIDRRQSILHTYWYFRVVAWLEENVVPGRLENAFVNPYQQVMGAFRERRRNNEANGSGGGHSKQVSVSSSSTFALPS